MTIGDRIRTHRINHQLSQKELASKLHVTPQTISKWENDLSEPGFQMITEITRIFQISHDELFVGKTEVIYQGVLYIAMKDLRMKPYYNFFLALSVFISLALMFTMSYLLTIERLPWVFPVAIGSLSLPFIGGIFMVANWRDSYSQAPEELLEIHPNHLVLKQEDFTIDFDNIQKIKASTYPFYRGIRVYDDNGYLMIETKTSKNIIVRDIANIHDIQKVIQKIKPFKQKEARQ